MKKEKYRLECSNCGCEPVSCDSGWGHDLVKEGQEIYCKVYNTKYNERKLHYCDQEEMEQSILETIRGEAQFGYEIRSFGKLATIIKKL